MQNDLASEEITTGLAVEEKTNALIVENVANGNGNHALLPRKKLLFRRKFPTKN
jgi:hypothetical protein